MLSASQQLAELKRGAVDILPEGELERKIERSISSGKPLRVKFGADPSAPDLHLGHVVPLRKLAQFQACGHQVIFLIGDFTGMIGDPTGKSETRRPLSREQVRENARTYEEQVFKILDRSRTMVRFNSEWMDTMKAAEMVRLCAAFTVARMIERDDFARRFADGRAIGIHEFLYPLVQGYDSVALDADIEVGGTDQKFNLLVAREIQRAYGRDQQAILTMPLLEGTDGRQKMSKSLGNAIGITDAPEEIFGRVMSLSDEIAWRYASLLLDLEHLGEEIRSGKVHPMEAKKRIAHALVARFHGVEDGAAARLHFERRFQERTDYAPDAVDVDLAGSASLPLYDLLRRVGFATSNSEARRLVAQGGVRIDSQPEDDPQRLLAAGREILLAVGRRRLAKVRLLRGTSQ